MQEFRDEIAARNLELYEHVRLERIATQAAIAGELALQGASFKDIVAKNHEEMRNFEIVDTVRNALPTAVFKNNNLYSNKHSLDYDYYQSTSKVDSELSLLSNLQSSVSVETAANKFEKFFNYFARIPLYVIGASSDGQLLIPPIIKYENEIELGIINGQSVYEWHGSKRETKRVHNALAINGLTPEQSAAAFNPTTQEFQSKSSDLYLLGAAKDLRTFDRISEEQMYEYNVIHHLSTLAVKFGLESLLADKLTQGSNLNKH